MKGGSCTELQKPEISSLVCSIVLDGCLIFTVLSEG